MNGRSDVRGTGWAVDTPGEEHGSRWVSGGTLWDELAEQRQAQQRQQLQALLAALLGLPGMTSVLSTHEGAGHAIIPGGPTSVPGHGFPGSTNTPVGSSAN